MASICAYWHCHITHSSPRELSATGASQKRICQFGSGAAACNVASDVALICCYLSLKIGRPVIVDISAHMRAIALSLLLGLMDVWT